MGETADEVKQRYERLSRQQGNMESMDMQDTPGASHPVHGADTDPYADTQSDAAFTEGAAGAAYASNMPIGLASESTVTAPLGEDLVDDPYGAASGGTFTADSSSTEFSSSENDTGDTGDDDIEASRAQIEHTRSEMSSTIDAIQEKLSPANLAEQAKDTVREATIGKAQNLMNDATDTAREAVSNAGDTALNAVSNAGDTARSAGTSIIGTIRENPIPAALVGVGIGWIFMKSRQSSGDSQSTFYSSNQGYDYRYDRGSAANAGSSSGTVSQAQNALGDAAGRVQDRAGQVTDQVQDKAGQLAGQVSSTAGNLTDQAQDAAQGAAQQVSGTVSQTLQENPLVLAAGVFAAGLAAGMAIPETDRENQLMGSARDTLAQKAQQTVQETAQKVQTVAQEAAGAAKQEAHDQNLT